MAQRTDFEYAAILLQNKSIAKDGHLFVVDLDACAAGLCLCDQGGVRLIGSAAQSGFSTEEFRRQLSEADPGGTQTPEHLAGEEIYRNYLRQQRTQDLPLWNGVSCRQLEAMFDGCRRCYESLFSRMDELLSEHSIDPDSVHLLLIGSMARNYLAELCARAYFSFAPLVPYDPIFLTVPDLPPNEIAARGRELDEQIQRQAPQLFGHRVELLLLDADGAETSVPLAQPDWNLKQSEKGFTSPVFLLLPGESLQLSVDQKRCSVAVPLKAASKKPLAVVAFVHVTEAKSSVVLRDANTSNTDIASMPIPNLGGRNTL